MKTPVSNRIILIAAAAAAAAMLLAACASAPVEPDGAAALRARLTQLQSDPQLGGRAPLAMEQANIAVTEAEKPETDKALSDHRLFMADRKISIAQAQAQSRLAVDQRKALADQREAMRLQERTQEADSANRRANLAQANANDQKMMADAANSRALAAQADASDQAQQADAARAAADDLQKQIDGLQARVTDRGLVLTLGDVLFASGSAQLNSGGDAHLGKLAAFLNKYTDRTAMIEGYTDSMGGDDYNLGLSQRRASAVKSYLVNEGIDSSRLSASGKGKDDPVADNGTSTGRQQNRRVEVIIQNSRVSAR